MGGSALSSGTDLSADASESCLDQHNLISASVRLENLKDAVQDLIFGIGEDVSRDGLRDTPKRVARAWLDASWGYRQTARSVVGGALFHEPEVSTAGSGLVIVRDVDFASTSESNLLPFYGRCHIGYMPSQGVVLGLSKVARLVTMFARRLQTQERFTQELLVAFEAEVLPQGCAVVVEAQQLEDRGRADVNITIARGGSLLQEHLMQDYLALLRLPGLSHSNQQPISGVLPKSAGNRGQLPLRGDVGAHVTRSCSCACPENQLSAAVANGLAKCMEEAHSAPVPAALENAVLSILRDIGEDPNREGLQGSAGRYVNFLLASTAGYRQPAEAGSLEPACHAGNGVLSSAGTPAEELHLHFMSHCEHHMLPFHGAMHVAYVPGPSGQRMSAEAMQLLLRTYSRRLQIQERLTQQVADAIHRATGAAGTLVVCEASHMCMVARGVEKHASSTVTMAARGACNQDVALRAMLLQRLVQ